MNKKTEVLISLINLMIDIASINCDSSICIEYLTYLKCFINFIIFLYDYTKDNSKSEIKKEDQEIENKK